MMLPGIENVALHLGAEGRRRWIETISAAQDAALEGALQGWAFHGTSLNRAYGIIRHGFSDSVVMLRNDPLVQPHKWTRGLHWATPYIAAFYAEKRAAQPASDSRPGLVAVRISDLQSCGSMEIDEQSMDAPITSRLGYSEDDIDALWEKSTKDWRASFDIVGSFAVVGRPKKDVLRVVGYMEDLEELIAEAKMHPEPSVEKSAVSRPVVA